jgi:hypothetical protein
VIWRASGESAAHGGKYVAEGLHACEIGVVFDRGGVEDEGFGVGMWCSGRNCEEVSLDMCRYFKEYGLVS